MEWALANRRSQPRYRISTILAVFERFNDVDIATATLADIVEMLKERRDLSPAGAKLKSTNAAKSSADGSDRNLRILLSAKDQTRLTNSQPSELLYDSSIPDPDGSGVPTIATVLEKINE